MAITTLKKIPRQFMYAGVNRSCASDRMFLVSREDFDRLIGPNHERLSQDRVREIATFMVRKINSRGKINGRIKKVG